CRRSAQAPARVTLRHNIWCGRELTGDPHTHTNREEAPQLYQILHQKPNKNAVLCSKISAVEVVQGERISDWSGPFEVEWERSCLNQTENPSPGCQRRRQNGHVAAQNQASGGVPSAMARALPR
ncbi:hypothetical protein, partial [Roseovarius sp. D0-M9]|uniref:hypothetical protein n=1 Tax=Roseovarius sp. D0-M9 TaxID=3127117 RepID=UPI0030105851